MRSPAACLRRLFERRSADAPGCDAVSCQERRDWMGTKPVRIQERGIPSRIRKEAMTVVLSILRRDARRHNLLPRGGEKGMRI